MSLESLAARVRPAVVQIFSTGYAAPEESDGSSTTSSLLSRQRSTGSGAIISPDGYIVTNAHVVQGGRKIEVKLPANPHAPVRQAGKTLLARVVGIDRETDIALLKIEMNGLPHLVFGNSNELKQGQIVLAFGNPLGLESSVSMGIISSTSRQLKPDDIMLYVQTDAPINPGNSGGPLVDVEGRVVGINTLIISQSGGSEGIGFAIPSSFARSIYTQLKKEGHVHRAQIGIAVQGVTPPMAQGLHLAQDWGPIVSDVQPDGPAEKAGLRVGDLITAIDGKPMETTREVELEIFRHPFDEKVKIEILRDSKKMTIPVEAIERKDDPQRFADMVNPTDNLIPKLGILAIQINEKLARMFPTLRREYGIVVAARSSEGAGNGLQAGDVIYAVNTIPAVTLIALKESLDNVKPGEAAVLQIERAGHLMFVTVELE